MEVKTECLVMIGYRYRHDKFSFSGSSMGKLYCCTHKCRRKKRTNTRETRETERKHHTRMYESTSHKGTHALTFRRFSLPLLALHAYGVEPTSRYQLEAIMKFRMPLTPAKCSHRGIRMPKIARILSLIIVCPSSKQHRACPP
jgi:hypothetical protein